MGVQSDVILACGGGGSSAFWRQMMADILGCPVATTISKEGPALGVAILAGVGAGLYPSVPEACRKIVGVNASQAPVAEHVAEYDKFYEIYRGLYPALKDSWH